VWQNLHYNFFLENGFLLGCNHSLANSLLHHELKCFGWIDLWWWWFGVVWVILISLMRMDWCGYNLVSNPFAGTPFVGAGISRGGSIATVPTIICTNGSNLCPPLKKEPLLQIVFGVVA